MNFALLLEKVIHLLTRSTQHNTATTDCAAMIFCRFFSPDTKRRDLLTQYGKNVKMSKVTCSALT